jgi:hypothetical protein
MWTLPILQQVWQHPLDLAEQDLDNLTLLTPQ